MPEQEALPQKPPDKPPHDEGLPPWMATFADMVTLLLCFFVLLLSFANQDMDKFKDALGSLRDAFGVRVIRAKSDDMALMSTTATMREKMAEITKEDRVLLGMVMRIKSQLSEDPELQKGTGVSADKNGVTFRVEGANLFKPGTAKLRPGADVYLDKVIAILKDYKLNLVVRGHTDNKENSTAQFPSNWELSSARAASALVYIMEEGDIAINRLRAVGYAHTRPVVSNNNKENRKKNQRVEFYFHWPEVSAW